MQASKTTHGVFGSDMLESWAEYAPPGPYHWAFRAISLLELASHVRPAANLIVSNVRGPAEPLAIAGVGIQRFYSVGPVLDGLALNVTAWSYAGALGVAALTCRRTIPEPQAIVDELHGALDALVAATRRRADGGRLQVV